MPYTPGMVVAPLRVPSREREQGAFVESPVAMRDDAHPRDNVASSVYSDYNAPLTVVPGPENPMPAVPVGVSSENNAGRNLTGTKNKRKSVKRTSRQHRMSQDSATEIESGAEEDDSQDLSPVAESPYSPSPLSSGKSPVSYPKIHKQGKNVNEGLQQLRDAQQALGNAGASTGPEPPRRNSKRMSKQQGQGQAQGQGRFPIRIVTPEERDNEGMRMGAVPHGTPQLTVGMSKPMNAPVVNSNNRNKNPGQMRTGSPEGRFPIAVPVEHQQQRQQPQRRQSSIATGGPNGYWNQQEQPQQAQEQQGEGSAYYYRAPSPHQWEQQQRQLQQAQRAQQQQQQSSYFRPSQGHYEAQQRQQRQQQRQYRSQQPPMPQQSWPIFAQPVPPHHQSQHQHTRTNSSSLLAKRLGAEKAAALALNPNPTSSSNKSIGRPAKGWARDGAQQQQARQHQQQQQQQPPPQYWQEGQAQNWGNNNNNARAMLLSQNPYSVNTNERFVDLPPPPITPGWVPELTPTRRGDDLFLNVQ